MGAPTVNSDCEFYWADLDGARLGPFQTERDGWRALTVMLLGQRDMARQTVAEMRAERDAAVAKAGMIGGVDA